MKDLIADIKNNRFKQTYLLYGEEQYLVQMYENKVKDKVANAAARMMNMDIYEGKAALPEPIENAVNTLPFMHDRRLVIVRYSGLFASGRKADSEKMANIVALVPETTLLLFVESDVDKRGKLYKETAKHGRIVEFKTPNAKTLGAWVIRTMQEKGKRIAVADADVLVRMAGGDMAALETEIEKLAAYVGEAADVTSADIANACTQSLQTKIFDMIDAVAYQKPETALDIFNNLIFMKESPVMIIALIGRQFRLMLQSKLLASGGLSPGHIAQQLEQRSFIVDECLRQGRHFTTADLERAVNDCLEADLSIKSGKIGDKLAAELLILKIATPVAP